MSQQAIVWYSFPNGLINCQQQPQEEELQLIPCDDELLRVRDAPQVTVMYATAITTTRRSNESILCSFRYYPK